ncbi:MAG: substrate-binding domain-containing protein [Thalassobaculum sp.]|uniref:substrate-binding domain-containing protein n=1 Tax=Thalassobaculum sp. TaxID=2022740 RepID=UPI0032EF2C12
MTGRPALWAAGSLAAAVADLTARPGMDADITVGPSGLLRRRIAAGERCDLFLSADLGHPLALARHGWASAVVRFAGNGLCALARPGLAVSPGTLLDVLLDPAVTVGTSTPGADPSGDYAWRLFAAADTLRPGARAALVAKARVLTGGEVPPAAPPGRHVYAWLVDGGQADLFLTYRTNAVAAIADNPALRMVDPPPALSVAASYALAVRRHAPASARRLALAILAPDGREVLQVHGFTTDG